MLKEEAPRGKQSVWASRVFATNTAPSNSPVPLSVETKVPLPDDQNNPFPEAVGLVGKCTSHEKQSKTSAVPGIEIHVPVDAMIIGLQRTSSALKESDLIAIGIALSHDVRIFSDVLRNRVESARRDPIGRIGVALRRFQNAS